MANLGKKVIEVDVSSKILVMSLLNDEEKEVIINVCNNKTDIERCLKKWKKETTPSDRRKTSRFWL